MSYSDRGARSKVPSRGGTTRSPMEGDNWRASSLRSANEERLEFDPSNVFKVKYFKKYSGNAPVMEKPKVLGSYSIDGDRGFVHDQSMLHFLDRGNYFPEDRQMTVNIDLKRGRDNLIKYRGNAQEGYHNFLRWIINNQDCLVDDSQKRLTADFISTRGSLAKIMTLPYNHKDKWPMYATEFKGSIYFLKWKSVVELAEENPVMEPVITAGQTFLHYIRGGDPDEGLDVNEEYRCVLKTIIGETSLLHAPEIDCADPTEFDEDFEDLDAFLLVKSIKELKGPQKVLKHKRVKLNELWSENRLSGIPRLLLGYRNEDYVVRTVELLKTDELPEIAGGEWDPNVCFNILAQFLEFVKERVHTVPGATFSFERESRNHNIYCKKLSGCDDINILPKWYKDGLFAEEESD